jgi:hypothetical protein
MVTSRVGSLESMEALILVEISGVNLVDLLLELLELLN